MSIDLLFDIFFKIIVMTGFGFFLKKKRILTEAMTEGLSGLLLKAILPVSVLVSSQSAFDTKVLRGMMLSAVISTFYYVISIAVSTAISTTVYHRTDRGKIFILMNVFANVGFIGMPLSEALCGKTGFLYAVIYNLVYQVFLSLYGIPALEGSSKRDWLKGMKDPLVLISILSVILFTVPFRFPVPLIEAGDMIGSMMVPVSMMIIGADIAEQKVGGIFREKQAFLVCILRLAIFPLIMLVVMKTLKIGTDVAVPMIMPTALPCGSLNVILAKEYHCEPEFASRTVILSMILMLVSLPLILMCAEAVGVHA